MSKQFSKDVLQAVKKKSGKSITESDIKKIASGVTPSTVNSEHQLRQLIKQVSTMAKVPVSESTVNDIIKAVKSSGVNPNNLEQLMKLINKK